jgi:hypothetical protein
VYPVVLRGSVPLFTVPQRTDLSLTASQAFESVLALTYVPATN